MLAKRQDLIGFDKKCLIRPLLKRPEARKNNETSKNNEPSRNNEPSKRSTSTERKQRKVGRDRAR